jgi:acetyl esterase/lipase
MSLTEQHEELIPLWGESAQDLSAYGQEGVYPGVQGHRNVRMIRNVTVPSLEVHRPPNGAPVGTGVIVYPGGSFVALTRGTGADVAIRLAEQGVTAFVLRYRVLPSPVDDEEFAGGWMPPGGMDAIRKHSRVALEDAIRAVGLVRSRTATWGLDKVGILGFSSGGILTLGAATRYDADTRPDFAAPIYPAPWHEYDVPSDAPPLYLTLATDDTGEEDTVVPSNLALYKAWRDAGHSVEMHIYAEGGHGFAREPQHLPCDTWIDRYVDWLRYLGLMNQPSDR